MSSIMAMDDLGISSSNYIWAAGTALSELHFCSGRRRIIDQVPWHVQDARQGELRRNNRGAILCRVYL